MTTQGVSIWFFIGVLLTIYGVLITGAGLYGVWHPPEIRLAELNAGVWWGLLLLVIGSIYSWAFRPSRMR